MTGLEAVELIHQEAWTGREPGLSRTIELLGRLGDPHKDLKFIHITGTNGKGSTASMVASVLQESGVKVGLYTSPHLWHFHERFRVNGQLMPDEALGRIAEQVILAARGMSDPATEFELMTAVGMVYFKEACCDIVVLEVGLGGRLDSTNVIPAPEVAVITNIGLEHTQELGNTKALIAREKAGIVKQGSSVVLYGQSREVEEVVEGVCAEVGAELTITKPDTLEILSAGLEGQTFRYAGEGPFHIHMLGDYQSFNATVAIEVIWALRKRGWNISDEALLKGLSNAAWPGRMELAKRNPDLFLDGGHNPQCMEALADSLAKLYPEKKIWFLTGVLADKDYPDMFRHILPLAKGFITITPDSPRAMSAQDLADYLRSFGKETVPCDSTAQALEQAMAIAGEDDVVCVCGSLYTIGEIRHLLGLC